MKKGLLYLLSAFMFLSFVSCDDDDDGEETVVEADYVGSWTGNQTQMGMSMVVDLTLTETTFDQLASVNMGTLYPYFGIKGSLAADGSTLNIVVTEAGMANYDMETHQISDIVWYDESDPEFSGIIALTGGANLAGEYEVSGSTLTLKIDLDDDGVYESENEVNEFTKVE